MNLQKWAERLTAAPKMIPFDPLGVLLIAGTYILGEIGFFPFGTTFRLGMGSVFYVLCLYSNPRLATYKNGFLTGAAVVLLRTLSGFFLSAQSASLAVVLLDNSHALLYYLALASGIIIFKTYVQKADPLQISLYFMIFDFLANLLELVFSVEVHLSWKNVNILVLGAGVKGLLFLAFIATSEFFRQRILRDKEREKFQGQLLMGTTLYAEGYFLKKIMKEIEEATEKSFQLYQAASDDLPGLQGAGQQVELLRLAERIHEIKKDTQRVFTSLQSLIEPNDYTKIDLEEAMNLVIESQNRYAQAHHKEVAWIRTTGVDYGFVGNFFPIMVVVNNILANAIDAIPERGKVAVIWQVRGRWVFLHLGNTGKPIPTGELALIFLPGFTTKYADSGAASTGIGLTHVYHVLSEVNGSVKVRQTSGSKTWIWFDVEIPLV